MNKTLVKLMLVSGVLLAALPAHAAVVRYRTGVFLEPAYGPWGMGRTTTAVIRSSLTPTPDG